MPKKTSSKPKPNPKHKLVYQLLRELQHRFRLDDWDIQLRILPIGEMPNRVGECRWDIRNMKAEIAVLEPDQNHYAGALSDMRLTLAHELIHVVLNPLFPDTKSELEEDMQEQAVERLAKAIVGV